MESSRHSTTCPQPGTDSRESPTHHPEIEAVPLGNSLVVQWLGLSAFTPEGPGAIPGRGTKIPQATQHGEAKKNQFPIRILPPLSHLRIANGNVIFLNTSNLFSK